MWYYVIYGEKDVNVVVKFYILIGCWDFLLIVGKLVFFLGLLKFVYVLFVRGILD